MKGFLCITLFSILCGRVIAQEPTETNAWSFNSDVNFYLIRDDFFVLPVFQAGKNRLHLEARYNYEDRETFSAWIGYNLVGGSKIEYTIIPMLGGVVGNTNGISAGLEMTFILKSFELYTESENVFDLESKDNNFFYNWTDLTWSTSDWLWFGISGQRTRLYQTDLEIQRGLLVGGALKNWELTGYLYNLGFDDPFGIITLSVSF
ncbi:hypothetical protein QQ054_22110 [Oscillatoria amoena NRMC-F 0135]|nr:hypothetical protein [Oscillatoria amoena NRMC-F 0135]